MQTRAFAFCVAGTAVIAGGCAGGDSTPGGGGGGGGGPIVSGNRIDTTNWRFTKNGSLGVAPAGLITPGAAVGVFVTSPVANHSPLPKPPTGSNFSVNDINSSGQILGDAHSHNGPSGAATVYDPYYWPNATSAPIALKEPAGVAMTLCVGLSNAGETIGFDALDIQNAFYWSSLAADPVPMTVPTDINLMRMHASGAMTFERIVDPSLRLPAFVKASGAGSLVQIQHPVGFTSTIGIIEGDDGVLIGTAINGTNETTATDMKPVVINPTDGTTVALPAPTAATEFRATSRNGSGWVGGFEEGTNRPILFRNGTSVFFDTIATPPAGVTLRAVVRVFENGSVLVNASGGKHYLYPAGSF